MELNALRHSLSLRRALAGGAGILIAGVAASAVYGRTAAALGALTAAMGFLGALVELRHRQMRAAIGRLQAEVRALGEEGTLATSAAQRRFVAAIEETRVSAATRHEEILNLLQQIQGKKGSSRAAEERD